LDIAIPTGQESFVGIYAQNRAEWIISEQAINSQSMVSVPLYDTLGADAVKFICTQAQLICIICDPPKVKPLLKQIKELPSIKYIIKMGDVNDEEASSAKAAGVQLLSFTDVEARGRSFPKAPNPPKPSDLVTMCYTSGTTGDPKGAMLTHANLIADTCGAGYMFTKTNLPQPVITPEDCHISYLPLAHMFERIVQCWYVQHGMRVGFFRGDVKLLLDDIETLKPTIFCSVPRLLNRVYDKVLAGVEAKGGLAKKLFEAGLAAKEQEYNQGIIRRNTIWDLLVFKKVQAKLGGRVRFIVTGAAPISEKCLTFLRCALGCPVVEGYGQTECTAGGTMTWPGDKPGCVGPPMVCGEIKLDTVADMKYFAEKDEGEVCFRGYHVMRGYFRAPDKTKEAIDDQGWLHSGDIGRWLPNGTLKIIDRKKAIFKLAQGEYIAPEKIENVYARAPSVAQIFVYGSSLEASLVAVVVPDYEVLPTWLPSHVPGVDPQAKPAELVKNRQVEKAIFDELIATGKAGGLQSFEQVRVIRLVAEAFSVENGLLTPTFKAKRPQLQAAFQNEIDDMYTFIHAEEDKVKGK